MTYNVELKREEDYVFSIVKKLYKDEEEFKQIQIAAKFFCANSEQQAKKPQNLMFAKDDYFEFNVLMFLEQLGSKVIGNLEYLELDSEGNLLSEEPKIIEITKFYLDLPKDQTFVKNHTFTRFWKTIQEIERLNEDTNQKMTKEAKQQMIESQV